MFTRGVVSTSIAMLAMASTVALAQPAADTAWDAGARAADKAYWDAYNRADPDGMNAWLAQDVEFYHDRGGKVIGKKAPFIFIIISFQVLLRFFHLCRQ